MKINADDLYRKLKELDERIRQNETPGGICGFDTEKVYLFLETALSLIPSPGVENDKT